MIYCNLKGGLGNMLFQISASLALAHRSNTQCSFPNLLNHLKILDDDIVYNPKLKHSKEYLLLLKNLNYFEPKLDTIPTLLFPFYFVEYPKITYDCYIDGFFQSEKYFLNEKDIILEYLNIPKEWDDYIKTKYSYLFKYKTTSIHIRRGDYLRLSNHHTVLDKNYYTESINFLQNKTDLFVVFSDDIGWCKDNIKNSKIIFIEDEKDYMELYLMSYCNNNIISNSSFSWWGAYLNKNDTKIVISPNEKSWFGPSNKHLEVKDLIPKSWVQM